MLRVGKSINYLLTNSDVNSVVKGKIYPLIAEQGTTYPFITYRRSGGVDNFSKDSSYLDTTNVELVIASTSYEEAVEIACKCREALEGKRYNNIKDIRLTDASEEFVEEAYTLNLLFTIKLFK